MRQLTYMLICIMVTFLQNSYNIFLVLSPFNSFHIPSYSKFSAHSGAMLQDILNFFTYVELILKLFKCVLHTQLYYSSEVSKQNMCYVSCDNSWKNIEQKTLIFFSIVADFGIWVTKIRTVKVPEKAYRLQNGSNIYSAILN